MRQTMTENTASSANNNCQDDYDPNSLSVNQALIRIKEQVVPLTGFEQIAIRDGLGRILAKDVLSTINVPAFTNSAMDGYALRYEDIQSENSTSLTVIGTAYAGKPYIGSISKGQCIRIMTGAPMPTDADTVVIQEQVIREANNIIVESKHKKGQNIRLFGEDLKIGEVALAKGNKLKAADIGLIASLGIAEIYVCRNIRVAFFSTGDELQSIGEPLQEGQIYDSNRYTVFSMLKSFGVDILDMGIIRDNPEDIRLAFETAASNADVLITTGGVSVGDADYVKQTLEALGEVNFWKIAMKPGRPLAVGSLGSTLFFGLPGNPVSAMVTFYQFVQPALRQLLGQKQINNTTIQLKCVSALKKRPGRVDFQRGIIFTDENGQYQVKTTGNQGSHVLSSMCQANCFIVLPQDSGNIEAGSLVEVQPFEGLM